MNLPPVLDRELRASGRSAWTYWMRVLAGVLMALFRLGAGIGEQMRWGWNGGLPTSLLGGMLLAAFHAGLMGVFFLVCPLVTADCLARERREGTLGLLFLTPLTAWQVVLGKSMAQVLRSTGLWLAVVPFMAIPFLMGGIGPMDFARAVTAQAVAVLTGLAAGFLATRCAVSWNGAVARGFGWAFLLWIVQSAVAIAVFVFVAWVQGVRVPDLEEWVLIPPGVLVASVLKGAVTGVGGAVVPGWMMRANDLALGSLLVLGLLMFVGSIVWTAISLKQQQQRRPGGESEPKAVSAVKPGKTVRRRRPGRYPVLWLELRGVMARRCMWGGVGLALGTWLLAWPFREVMLDPELAELLPILVPGPMVLALGLAAAGSFRQEVEEGTLEILLVTGLRPRELLEGRCMALWRMFGPGLVVSVLLGFALADRLEGEELNVWLTLCLSSGLTLPAVGMRCAMRRLTPLWGWMLTLGWGVVVPVLVGGFLRFWSDLMFNVGGEVVGFAVFTCLVQLVAAAWWGRMTIWDLETRSYQMRPLQRAPG
jgi:ABC-type transport system involved in cytochrome c biogenesis permease component